MIRVSLSDPVPLANPLWRIHLTTPKSIFLIMHAAVTTSPIRTLFSLFFLILLLHAATARDYRKALLFGRSNQPNDPATRDTTTHKPDSATMGQCLSAAAQETIQNVWQVAGEATAASTKTAPGVHDSLPSNAERVTVRNVYDGDTLTLIDERRVRLLGIDTPEIKERQPFAQEAKAYTKSRCHKKQIWLSYDGNDQQDHYGRLLAYVWIQQPDGRYLCINEGIVAEGLAFAYAPRKDTKLKRWPTLLRYQSQAMEKKQGVWKDFKDVTVYKTANGSAYHSKDCEHIANVRRLTPLKASEAISQGLHPCRTCQG